MSGIVLLYRPPGLREEGLVGCGAIGDIGIKAVSEEPDQLQGYLGVAVEGALDILQAETVRLVVGQVRVGESDHSVHQRGVLTGHQAGSDELPVGMRPRGEYLRVIKLLSKLLEQFRPVLEEPLAATPDKEGSEEVGV